MILLRILIFIIDFYYNTWPPSIKGELNYKAYLGSVLCYTDMCLVGYFVSVWLWPCWFLVSLLPGSVLGRMEKGSSGLCLWSRCHPCLQQDLCLGPRQAPASCSLLLTIEHPLGLWNYISSSSPSISFHPPPSGPEPGSITPNFVKFGHSHAPIRSSSEAPCPSWGLNTGTKNVHRKINWSSPSLAAGFSTCIRARAVCTRDVPDCISPAPKTTVQTSDLQSAKPKKVLEFVKEGQRLCPLRLFLKWFSFHIICEIWWDTHGEYKDTHREL